MSQEKKKKDEGLRKGDQKKTKDALEKTNTEAEKQKEKTGIGAGVVVSQAGEAITVESVRMLKDGMSEDEIRSEMHKVVNTEDSVLDSESGREWADNGVNCALKIQDKMEKELYDYKSRCR